jgi:hypothetical protein
MIPHCPQLSAVFYNANVAVGATKCYGVPCYQDTFLVLAGMCAFAAVVCGGLALHDRRASATAAAGTGAATTAAAAGGATTDAVQLHDHVEPHHDVEAAHRHLDLHELRRRLIEFVRKHHGPHH